MDLDLRAPVGELTRCLVDVPSVSGDEAALADAVQAALGRIGGLRVERDGDAVVARTSLGLPSRIVLAGHLDTVPIADNLPSRVEGGRLYGCGTSDMKAGVAIALRLAATLPLTEPGALRHDITWICYDHEEVEAARNGLRRLAAQHRDWLDGDLAILMEPTSGEVEAGCQGTLRVIVRLGGRRAHSARSWLGDNAIHKAGALLQRLAAYEARSVTLDGCTYREGLSAVRVDGGVAGNVIPDACAVTVNFRFAPDRTPQAAVEHVREVLAGYECEVTDLSGGAPPGLAAAPAAAFVAATGRTPVAKYGWTDVARFAELGIPALNYGPGDPNLAHTREEYVELAAIDEGERLLRGYLTGALTA
ncbi:succinyl-diaminopimelate desuccinylase [Frankia sp. Ag45/Mut15]|uniref:Succinyl-diaminopimelate desuccinylase n=1 Tax=Frankia umida TaxID=573489 RepID=A0ABT0JVU9_9ACTN|nr:succinyl-diaminopimelate desuccinylase [Frankia umida]MCK9875675.1 succinyl-diaminopimelate desuccinylase [Frankia umida]